MHFDLPRTSLVAILFLLATAVVRGEFNDEFPLVLQTRSAETGVVVQEPANFDATTTLLLISGSQPAAQNEPATELDARTDQLAKRFRAAGATVLHVPLGGAGDHDKNPARQRARELPPVTALPDGFGDWKSDTKGKVIALDAERDFISADGSEVWSLVEQRQIEAIVVIATEVGDGKNAAPAMLTQLGATDKTVVLVRDLASNPAGITVIEQSICPTISSGEILGGDDFRSSADMRKNLLIMIGENEYSTNETLPKFADAYLAKDFRVRYSTPAQRDPYRFLGFEAISVADILLVSVRRRALPDEQLAMLREYVGAGKPIAGIRTASHAFSLRGKPAPDGHGVWDDWDAEVFGGNYSGHHKNELRTHATTVAGEVPFVLKVPTGWFGTGGSLYEVSPLNERAIPIMVGYADTVEKREPVAWVFEREGGGRSFYTSLGHVDDFGRHEFQRLLIKALEWCVGE